MKIKTWFISLEYKLIDRFSKMMNYFPNLIKKHRIAFTPQMAICDRKAAERWERLDPDGYHAEMKEYIRQQVIRRRLAVLERNKLIQDTYKVNDYPSK